MARAEPIRVVHLAPALFGGADGIVGGAERYALELARHMARETPTTLLSFGDVAREEALGPLKVRVLGHPWHVRRQRTNPVSLALFGALAGAEVVHCHQQHILASSLAAAFSRLSGKRAFVTDLGGGGWDVSAYCSTDRWYDGHLHLSAYSRQVFGHANKAWAQVILGGVDVEKFCPDEAAPRTGSVLFVGRLLPHKGVNYLIEAVDSQVRTEIIGAPCDPKFLGDLQALARGKAVTFNHQCGDEDLVRAYRRALCIVLPSVYRTLYGAEGKVPELLGQTLLEGMACGTPAIGTKVASLPEVVVEGVTGFLVPPNDPAALKEKIDWLVHNPAQAAEMGRAARQHVLDKFTWPAVVRRCLEFYRASLG